MGILALTDSGQAFSIRPDFSSAESLYYPLGVAPVLHRVPTGGLFQQRSYLAGAHTALVMIDEHHRLVRQSIPQPIAAPTVSATAGTVPQVAYTRFYDEKTDERGPLSAGTSFTGGESRTWTALPTVVPGDELILDGIVTIAAGAVTGTNTNFRLLRPGDRIAISGSLTRWARIRSITSGTAMTLDDTTMAGVGVTIVAKAVRRASHVELWIAPNGGLPRLAMQVRIGTTSVSESVSSLSLGQAEVTAFTAMPFGPISLIYNKRQLIAGVKGHEDEIFLSIIGFPERHAGLSFKTDFGEPVTGMFRHGKYVVVLCPNSSYVLQGVADDDYVLDGLDPTIGGYGCWATVKGVTYVPGSSGVQAFNGAFHSAIPTREDEWILKAAKYKIGFQNGWIAWNRADKTIQFHPNTRLQSFNEDSDRAAIWVGQYSSVAADDSGNLLAPDWVNDGKEVDTSEESASRYLMPGNATGGAFYRGTIDGRIFEEDQTRTVAFTGTGMIVLRHDVFDDYGGTRNQGKTLTSVDSYVKSETTAWTLKVWPGDEYAFSYLSEEAVKEIAVAASAMSDRTPKTVHTHPIINKDGRGFSLQYLFDNPKDVEFFGWGGFVEMVGIATRPPIVISDPG